jgi:hypothetical protein
MGKFFLSIAAAFVMLSLSSVTRADDVSYNGSFGATATVSNFTLNGNTFTFTIQNTAASGSITAIGFDLSGNRPETYSIFSATCDKDESLVRCPQGQVIQDYTGGEPR